MNHITSGIMGTDELLEVLAGFGIAGSIVSIVVGVFLLASLWCVFTKAGVAGWKSLIPLYNMYILYKMAWGNGWLFLLTIIPVVNVVIGAICMYKLSKAFGHSFMFALGLIFLPYVFYPILAFGTSRYLGIAQ